jgi:Cdc6-like AAA superfamily ATPase
MVTKKKSTKKQEVEEVKTPEVEEVKEEVIPEPEEKPEKKAKKSDVIGSLK